MSLSDRWLLPDGVDELLPPDAWTLEQMRRAMLDSYASYGYELVAPPLIEFIESLLTGTGNNLDLKTFKVTDQLTGRMMGVRADITPQVARIDSHLLKSTGVSRLCYADTVLHTRPAHTMTNRSPKQIGCELFGEPSVAADLEVMSLMLETLKLAGVKQVHIDLAHVGVYKGLIESAELNATTEAEVFDALNRKSIPELDALAETHGSPIIEIIRDIAKLSGGIESLESIKTRIQSLTCDMAFQAISALQAFASSIQQRFPEVDLGYDFCELRGYNYHTGIMFSAYTPGFGYALAKGGRYDAIGKDFGASRPATGFSADLKTLVRLDQYQSNVPMQRVFAPMSDDLSLLDKIKVLRKTKRVVQALNAYDTSEDLGCTQSLVNDGGEWVLKDI
jgi:ATP phosphoribosyltransferase regulatory subunit